MAFSCLLFSNLSFAQKDYSWWNNQHNWDGTTHWSRYIILSPAYMGPNALPIPEVKNGLISQNATLNVSVDYHHSKGDQTQNAFLQFFTPLFSNRVGLNVTWVPYEIYETDTITRDLRRDRERSGNGGSPGDIYFSTFIQLVEDHDFLPEMVLSMNFKTASGGGLSSARHTDAPAYFFDLSTGKSIPLGGNLFKTIRPHLMFGFYVWQTFRQDYYQNDALLYGGGVDLKGEKLEITNAIGGYYGYINDGDRPMVYRFDVKLKPKGLLNYSLRFQQGLNDFEFSTFRLGAEINLNKLKK